MEWTVRDLHAGHSSFAGQGKTLAGLKAELVKEWDSKR